MRWAAPKLRAAHGNDVGLDDVMNDHVGKRRRPQVDGGVELLGAVIEPRQSHRAVDRDVRVRLEEARQAAGEPGRGKRRRNRELEDVGAVGVCHGPLGGDLERVERLPDVGKVAAPGVAQRDALPNPPEQRRAELRFELSNLPAHRPLREMELGGGPRDAAVACGALEGHQRGNRWEGGLLHAPLSRAGRRIMPKWHDVSGACIMARPFGSAAEAGS